VGEKHFTSIEQAKELIARRQRDGAGKRRWPGLDHIETSGNPIFSG